MRNSCYLIDLIIFFRILRGKCDYYDLENMMCLVKVILV